MSQPLSLPGLWRSRRLTCRRRSRSSVAPPGSPLHPWLATCRCRSHLGSHLPVGRWTGLAHCQARPLRTPVRQRLPLGLPGVRRWRLNLRQVSCLQPRPQDRLRFLRFGCWASNGAAGPVARSSLPDFHLGGTRARASTGSLSFGLARDLVARRRPLRRLCRKLFRLKPGHPFLASSHKVSCAPQLFQPCLLPCPRPMAPCHAPPGTTLCRPRWLLSRWVLLRLDAPNRLLRLSRRPPLVVCLQGASRRRPRTNLPPWRRARHHRRLCPWEPLWARPPRQASPPPGHRPRLRSPLRPHRLRPGSTRRLTPCPWATLRPTAPLEWRILPGLNRSAQWHPPLQGPLWTPPPSGVGGLDPVLEEEDGLSSEDPTAGLFTAGALSSVSAGEQAAPAPPPVDQASPPSPTPHLGPDLLVQAPTSLPVEPGGSLRGEPSKGPRSNTSADDAAGQQTAPTAAALEFSAAMGGQPLPPTALLIMPADLEAQALLLEGFWLEG